MNCEICGKKLSGRQKKACSANCRKKLRRIYSKSHYEAHRDKYKKAALDRFYRTHPDRERKCQVCGAKIAQGKICEECRIEQEKLGISVSALKTRRFSGFRCEEDIVKAHKEKSKVLFTNRLRIDPTPCDIVEVQEESHTRGLMRRLR